MVGLHNSNSKGQIDQRNLPQAAKVYQLFCCSSEEILK